MFQSARVRNVYLERRTQRHVALEDSKAPPMTGPRMVPTPRVNPHRAAKSGLARIVVKSKMYQPAPPAPPSLVSEALLTWWMLPMAYLRSLDPQSMHP
jgi:hypothetical protein